MTRTNRHHLSANGNALSGSRFSRFNEVLPYTFRVADSFIAFNSNPETKGVMMDGKMVVFSESTHLSRSGVKYNRLLRLRRRLFINREQGRRVNI